VEQPFEPLPELSSRPSNKLGKDPDDELWFVGTAGGGPVMATAAVMDKYLTTS
jgi:hypothetical protein